MKAIATRFHFTRLLVTTFAVLALTAAAANAAVIQYVATLNGASEAPPNASPGIGSATLDVDTATHMWTMHVQFSGLLGNTTAAHTHAATTVPGAGTAGVATTTPYFAGFPIGVTSGTYDNTFDMTQASSFNASYITAHGGTTTQAELDLAQAIAEGRAYLNIHTNVVPAGEIRGFWTAAVPAQTVSWGRIRNLYR